MVSSVDRPVNVVMGLQGVTLSLAELSAIGVKRIASAAPSLAPLWALSFAPRGRCASTARSPSPRGPRTIGTSTRCCGGVLDSGARILASNRLMKLPVAALLLTGVAAAAILPDTIGPYHRASSAPAATGGRAIWDEYGLKESETVSYENGKDKFTATAYRLQDTTASMAAFEWQRPGGSHAAKAATLAAETADSLLVVHGNYLLAFQGYKPDSVELGAVEQALNNVDTTVLPVLTSYLPREGLVPNSERYVIGPASLEKFDPGIPPSVAAFHFGTEARTGVFHSPKGDMTLAIFNYPTSQIAIERAPEFEKLRGAVVKRSGPLVAVVLAPPDPDLAERVLAGIRYQAVVTRDEYVPTRRDNIGVLILNIFVLIGILLAFSVVSGLAVGGVRAWLRHGRHGEDADPMITLHLERR